MSLALMVDVMTQVEVTRPQLLVLLAMADHANDDGSRCFPSVDRIAWKMGYKPRAVIDIMRDLRRAGVLVVVAPASHHRPTEYRINLSAAPPKPDFETWKAANSRHAEPAPTVPDAPESGVQSHGSGENRGAFSRDEGCNLTSSGVHFHVNGTRENAPEPSIEPLRTVKEPSDIPLSENSRVDSGEALDAAPARKRRQRNVYPPDFERFWSAYPPGHGTKTLAFTEWKKLDVDEDLLAAILAGIEQWRLSEKWLGGFIRDAERFLKYREWENPGAPPQTPTNPTRAAGGPYLAPDRDVDWDEEERQARERRRDHEEAQRRRAAGAGEDFSEPGYLPGGADRPARVA